MSISDDHYIAGFIGGLFSFSVPDAFLTFGEKALMACIVAVISGFFYAMGKSLWERVSHKRN